MIRERRKSFYLATKQIKEHIDKENQILSQLSSPTAFRNSNRLKKPPIGKEIENNTPKKRQTKLRNKSKPETPLQKQTKIDENYENEIGKFIAKNEIKFYTPKVRLNRLSKGTISRAIKPNRIDHNQNEIVAHFHNAEKCSHGNDIQANNEHFSNKIQTKQPLILHRDDNSVSQADDLLSVISDSFSSNECSKNTGTNCRNSSIISNQFSQCHNSQNETTTQKSSSINGDNEIDNMRNAEEQQFHDQLNDSVESESSEQSNLEIGLANQSFNRGKQVRVGTSTKRDSFHFNDVGDELLAHSFSFMTKNSNVSSNNSLVVQNMTAQINSLSGNSAVRSHKCFPDSKRISYGGIIEFENIKFAVNCFEHNDKSIQHHFLSKFNRTHFHSIKMFEGILWMSEITGHLMSIYSSIDESRFNVLKYNTPVSIDNITVTAIEVPKFPGGTLFLFASPDEKYTIHAADFRLPIELESNETLMANTIHHIYFDRSLLSQLCYQFPVYTNRYVKLMSEITRFVKECNKDGLLYLIAIGSFEIGMEYFIYKLCSQFTSCQKIYVDANRRQFLNAMASASDPNTLIHKLNEKLTDFPSLAKIHVLQVHEISSSFLSSYIRTYNFHRVLGIRPRCTDGVMNTVVETEKFKIVDVANPLIGDTEEYEKFVMLNV